MKDFLFILLAWLLTLPFLVGAIAFAIYNGMNVAVVINPFQTPINSPLYVPVLIALAIGFLFGSLMTWAAMGRLRSKCGEQAKKIKILEKQLEVGTRPEAIKHNYSITPLKLLGRR